MRVVLLLCRYGLVCDMLTKLKSVQATLVLVLGRAYPAPGFRFFGHEYAVKIDALASVFHRERRFASSFAMCDALSRLTTPCHGSNPVSCAGRWRRCVLHRSAWLATGCPRASTRLSARTAGINGSTQLSTMPHAPPESFNNITHVVPFKRAPYDIKQVVYYSATVVRRIFCTICSCQPPPTPVWCVEL